MRQVLSIGQYLIIILISASLGLAVAENIPRWLGMAAIPSNLGKIIHHYNPKPLDKTLAWQSLEQKTPQQKSVPTTHPVILHFWATWCPPCLIELPKLDQFAKENNMIVWAISLDRKQPEEIKQFWQDQGMKHLRLGWDNSFTLMPRLQLLGLPSSIFVYNGQETGRVNGDIDWTKPLTTNRVLRLLVQ